MDLSVPLLAGLSYLGYNISKKKTQRKNKKLRDELLGREKPTSRHTFNSTFVKESELKELEKSTLNYIKSQSPALTNVVNSVYPLDCSDKNVYCNTSYDTYEEKDKILSGPLFNEKMDYLYNKYLIEPMDSNQQLSDLSGMPMEMSHTNMMPYTTLKGDSRIYTNNNVNQILLDKYTGRDKTTMPKNTEPFFKPVPQRLPNEPTFTQKVDRERYNTSKLISGVSPVPQITVGKIPQQLITTPVKNVDQLRNRLYPRLAFEQRTNHAKGNAVPATIENYTQKSRSPRQFELGISRSAVSSQYKKQNASNELTDYRIKDCKTGYNEGYIPSIVKRINNYLGLSDLFNYTTGFKKDALDTAEHNVRNVRMNDASQYTNDMQQQNTYVKEQSRDTTIFNQYSGPVSKGNFGFTQREYDENPNKITNREMNLTSYSGITSNPVKGPMDYNSFLDNARINNTKIVKQDHFNAGGRQMGITNEQFGEEKLINKVDKIDYFSNTKVPIQSQRNIQNEGLFEFNNSVSSSDFLNRYTYMGPAALKTTHQDNYM